MNFDIKKIDDQTIDVTLKRSDVRSGQLFYGPVSRGLDYKIGYYNHTDSEFLSGEESWQHRNIDRFITFCQNGSFPGVYVLWFLCQLPILSPKFKKYSRSGKSGKRSVSELEENIETDCYYIRIDVKKTKCDDVDSIISEIFKALEGFDVNTVFNEMIQSYKDAHPVTFPSAGTSKFFGLLKMFSSKEEREKRPYWTTLRDFPRSWSYKEALKVFTDEFSENRQSF